jgi:hypothetical protein
MTKYIFIIIIILSLFVYSCHEYYLDEDYPCGFCYNIEPDEGILFINLTIDNHHKDVPIVIYRGLMDQGDTIWVDTATATPYDIGVPIDDKYTVTAEYMVDEKKIIAVDNDRVYMRKNTTDCDEDCWIIFDGEVDLTLKYD